MGIRSVTALTVWGMRFSAMSPGIAAAPTPAASSRDASVTVRKPDDMPKGATSSMYTHGGVLACCGCGVTSGAGKVRP